MTCDPLAWQAIGQYVVVPLAIALGIAAFCFAWAWGVRG